MIYVVGTAEACITVGMAHCSERQANLPFIAFAPTDRINEALNLGGAGTASITGEDEIKSAIDAFREHGTVVFIDNPVAAERMFEMVDALFAIAADTDWGSRIMMKKEMMN